MSETVINQFQATLKKAIDIRESALYHENPLFTISMSVEDEEITRKEQALLECVLEQFNKMFIVESLCTKCLQIESCNYSSDDIGECERYKGAC